MASQARSNAASGKSALSSGRATVTRMLNKSVRVQELLVLVVGLICYITVSHMFITIQQNSSTILSGPVFPALFVPLLVGILFGPWTGFFVGSLGYLASYYLNFYITGIATCGIFHASSAALHYCNYAHVISGKNLSSFLGYTLNYYHTITIPPFGWAIGIGLIGLIAGFVRQPIQGFLSGLGLLLIAGGIGAIALLSGALIAAFAQDILLQASHQMTATPVSATFDPLIAQLVLGFVLAPIAVLLYNIGRSISKQK